MTTQEKHIDHPLHGIPWRAFSMTGENGFKDFAKQEGYHPLDIESCYQKRETAKVINRKDYVFVVAKVARFEAKSGKLHFDDIDIFIKPDSLVTVEENPGKLIDGVRNNFPRSSDEQADDIHHLMFAILDEIVDQYLVTLDTIGERIQAVEAEVWKRPTPQTLEKLFKVRHSLIDFRRNAGGMREVVSILIRDPRIKTNGDLESYYRDLYEHTIRVIEFIETYRDVLNGTLDIYVSALAQRTNEISKVLAVYGTIALPFLIITGMYGMNIKLPFAQSPYAFEAVLVVMAIFAAVALISFKRKDWF